MGLGGLKNITPTPGRSTKIPNPNDNSSKNPKENGEIIQTDENEEKELELEEELQKIDYKDDIIEIMEDPIMALRDLPNFFQTQSKRKQPKYGVDKIDKKEKGDMNFKGRQPNFLDIRKKEILDDESKNKDMIKLQPITFFLDSYGNKIKHVEMPYYSLEVFSLVYLFKLFFIFF